MLERIDGQMVDRTFSQFHHEPKPEYDFYDINTYNADNYELNPDAGITFGPFDSVQHGWWLSKRDLSTPEEYEIVDSVPYMQGEYDFSVIDKIGERYYKERELKYEFLIVDDDPQYREGELQSAKRELFYPGPYNQQDQFDVTDKVLDTGYPSYYFKGKCKSVTASDDDEKGVMTVTIEFKVYPYAIARHDEGSDIWDEIDFDHYADNETVVHLSGEQTSVAIYNFDKPIRTTMVVNGNFTVGTSQHHYVLNSLRTDGVEKNNNKEFILTHGANYISVEGTGTIRFKYKREVMI